MLVDEVMEELNCERSTVAGYIRKGWLVAGKKLGSSGSGFARSWTPKEVEKCKKKIATAKEVKRVRKIGHSAKSKHIAKAKRKAEEKIFLLAMSLFKAHA